MVGFYGKLPSHGDFVSRSVASAFIDRWDAWLQAGVAQSHVDLGDRWLDLFLTSPVWRFALQAGVITGGAFAGILLPSVDRVGRYFPLTIVAELPTPRVHPQIVSVAAAAWLDWVEAVARRALEEEILDLDSLLRDLRASEPLLGADRLSAEPIAVSDSEFPGAGAFWRFSLDSEADMGRFYARLSSGLAGNTQAPLALWWTAGSDRVQPSVLMSRGLPPPATFQDFLRPQWNAAWRSESADFRSSADADQPSLRCRSAAVTDTGVQRSENQDAFVERAGEGFWLVADGMGGHQAGGYASQLAAQWAAAAEIVGDVTVMAGGAAQALQSANDQLRRRAVTEPGFDAGTTVVAVCIRGASGIVEWAGDSRLYRVRDGTITQLTRDHTIANESGGVAKEEDAHVITRALGSSEVLELDRVSFEVRDRDRYLLCTDGLYADLTSDEIAGLVMASDCTAAANSLVALALRRGGDDNMTAVVIEVYAYKFPYGDEAE